MKMQRETVRCTQPQDCCGRCVWWTSRSHPGYGKCLYHLERRWYSCIPCTEYERDSQASDTIDVYKTDVA